MLIRRPTTQIDDSESLTPLLHRLFSGRGITSALELQHDLSELLPPNTMLGLEKAATRLANAVQQARQILIVGDYDADGATSSALMVSALRAMG